MSWIFSSPSIHSVSCPSTPPEGYQLTMHCLTRTSRVWTAPARVCTLSPFPAKSPPWRREPPERPSATNSSSTTKHRHMLLLKIHHRKKYWSIRFFLRPHYCQPTNQMLPTNHSHRIRSCSSGLFWVHNTARDHLLAWTQVYVYRVSAAHHCHENGFNVGPNEDWGITYRTATTAKFRPVERNLLICNRFQLTFANQHGFMRISAV